MKYMCTNLLIVIIALSINKERLVQKTPSSRELDFSGLIMQWRTYGATAQKTQSLKNRLRRQESSYFESKVRMKIYLFKAYERMRKLGICVSFDDNQAAK